MSSRSQPVAAFTQLTMVQNTEPFVQSGEPLHDFLRSFWQRQVDAAEQEVPDYRHPPLPLARIKKVMKSDPDVKVRPNSSTFQKTHGQFYRAANDCSRWYALFTFDSAAC